MTKRVSTRLKLLTFLLVLWGITLIVIWESASAASSVYELATSRPYPAVGQPIDPVVEEALNLLAQTRTGKHLAALARRFQVGGGTIAFEQLAATRDKVVFGDFHGSVADPISILVEGRININSEFRASPEIVAGVIAHEASHIEDALGLGPDALKTGTGCFDTEAKAFVSSMRVWGELRQRTPLTLPSREAQNALSALERQYTLFVRLVNGSNRQAALSAISKEIEQVYAEECISAAVEGLMEKMSPMVGSNPRSADSSGSATASNTRPGQGGIDSSQRSPRESSTLPAQLPIIDIRLLPLNQVALLVAGLAGAGVAFLLVALAQFAFAPGRPSGHRGA